MLELLAATLPELRRGLTEGAARTVAYELFEKLGFGAVAVTDRHAGARVRRRRRRPPRRGRRADPARCTRRLARRPPLLAPLGIRAECGHPACPLGAAAVVPLRLSDGAGRRGRRVRDRGSPLDEAAVEMLEQLGDQLSAQLQLSELATATSTALQAQMEPHFVFNALNTIASLIRTEPDRARGLVLAFADYVR